MSFHGSRVSYIFGIRDEDKPNWLLKLNQWERNRNIKPKRKRKRNWRSF